LKEIIADTNENQIAIEWKKPDEENPADVTQYIIHYVIE
jgi:hypothetical protein